MGAILPDSALQRPAFTQDSIMHTLDEIYSILFSTSLNCTVVVLLCIGLLEYNATSSLSLALGWILCVVVVFRFVKAKKPTQLQSLLIQQFAWDKIGTPAVIGHRGVTETSPENTLSAITDAAKAGCGAVELDLAFTSDGVGVLMHDDLVDRTTDHTGRVDQHTYETVQKMAIKHAYLQDKHVERVPDLEEALLLAMELGLKVFIDCKSDAGATARLITKLFDQHPALYEMCAVCSFHPDIIYAVRKSNPRILTGLTYTRIFLEMEPVTAFDFFKVVVLALSDAVWGWAFHNWAWLFLGVNCVLLDVNSISRDEIKKWKARGIPAFVWTVNDLSTMRWLHSHGVSFMTDVPENFNVPDNGL